ncbi:ATP-binding protein [Nanoarchaeota archaeon]
MTDLSIERAQRVIRSAYSYIQNYVPKLEGYQGLNVEAVMDLLKKRKAGELKDTEKFILELRDHLYYNIYNNHFNDSCPGISDYLRMVALQPLFDTHMYIREEDEDSPTMLKAMSNPLFGDFEQRYDIGHDIGHILIPIANVLLNIYQHELNETTESLLNKLNDTEQIARILSYPAKTAVESLIVEYHVDGLLLDEVDMYQLGNDVASAGQLRFLCGGRLFPIVGPEDILETEKIILDNQITSMPKGSEGMFFGVLSNFVNNAVKKIEKDIASGRAEHYTPQISIELRELADGYYMAVGDNAAGISIDQMLKKAGEWLKKGKKLRGISDELKDKLLKYQENPLYLHKITGGDISNLCFVQGLSGFADERLAMSSGMGLYGVQRITENLGGQTFATSYFGEKPYFMVVIPKDKNNPIDRGTVIEKPVVPFNLIYRDNQAA